MAAGWEQTPMVWVALKDPRSKRRSLSIICLDLANAYGSVPHVLILFALGRYKIPEDWITLVIKKNFMASFYGRGSTASRLEPLQGGSLLFTTKYYNGLWGRTSASGFTSDWY